VESKLGPLGTSATYWPIVPAPGNCEDGEFGGMNGRGNLSTRRKPAPTPLRPPRIPLDARTRAAAVGSQRLTASAMARPSHDLARGLVGRHIYIVRLDILVTEYNFLEDLRATNLNLRIKVKCGTSALNFSLHHYIFTCRRIRVTNNGF
jgi:hypothetical protein